MASLERRYWDSAVFIAAIKGEPGRKEICEQVLHEAVAGNCEIVTSALTLTEVVRPHKKSIVLSKQNEDRIVAFFKHSYIKLVELDRTVGEMARRLIWEFNLGLPDSIHLASAIHANAHIVESWDDKLLKLNGKIPGSPSIREPAVSAPQLPFPPPDTPAAPPDTE